MVRLSTVLVFCGHRKGIDGSKCGSSTRTCMVRRVLQMEWPLILLIVFIVLVSTLLGVAATLIILHTRVPTANVGPDLLKTGQLYLTTVLPPSPPPLPPPPTSSGSLIHPDMPSEQKQEQAEHPEDMVTMLSILEENASDPQLDRHCGRSQEPHCESAASRTETTPFNLCTLHDTALRNPCAEVGIQIPQRCSRCRQAQEGQTLPLEHAPRQALHESLQDVARYQGHWQQLPWSEWSIGSFGSLVTQRWPALHANIGNSRNLSAGTAEVLSIPAGQPLPLEHRRHVPGPGHYACSFVPRDTTWPMEPIACTDGCNRKLLRDQPWQPDTLLNIPDLVTITAQIPDMASTLPIFRKAKSEDGVHRLCTSQQPRCQPAETQTAPILYTPSTLQNTPAEASNPHGLPSVEVAIELPQPCRRAGPGPALPLVELLQLQNRLPQTETSSKPRQCREETKAELCLQNPRQNRIIRRSNAQPRLSFVVPVLVPAIEWTRVQKPLLPLPNYKPDAPQIGRAEVEPRQGPDLWQIASQSLAPPSTMTAPAWPTPATLAVEMLWPPDVRAIPGISGPQGPINHTQSSQVNKISKLPALYQQSRQTAFRQTPVVHCTAEPFNPDAYMVWRIDISLPQTGWPNPMLPRRPLPTREAPALQHRRTRQALRKPMARVLRPRVPRYPPHPRPEPPELPLKVPLESLKSSPRSSPGSSPSGYLTSTLGGPFWTKGSKGEHKVGPRNDRNDSPGPGDYSPEHPGIRGRIPGRVPGFPENPNAARCNQPGPGLPGLGVLLPLDAVRPKSAGAPRMSKSRRSGRHRCLAHLTGPRIPKGPKILRLNDKPTVITYRTWSPGRSKF